MPSCIQSFTRTHFWFYFVASSALNFERRRPTECLLVAAYLLGGTWDSKWNILDSYQEARYQEEKSSEQREMYQLGTLQSLSYASTVLSCVLNTHPHTHREVWLSPSLHQQMETTTDRQLVKIQRTLTVGHPAHMSPTQPLYLPRAQRTSRKKAEKDEKSQKTRESAARLRVPDITWKLYPWDRGKMTTRTMTTPVDLAVWMGKSQSSFPLQMKSYRQLKLAQSMVVFSRDEHPK